MAAGGQAIQVRHREIHQDHFRPVAAIGADRSETGVDDVDDLVTGKLNHLREGPGEGSFVVGYKHTHT